MKYITGIHALNLDCSLNTCGDWHTSGIQWESPYIKESINSTFGNYGIEDNCRVPQHPGSHKVANHIRALLDLLEDGNFGYAQGMKNDFICSDEYNSEIFEKILLLKSQENWKTVNSFMGKEYGRKWLDFIKYHG